MRALKKPSWMEAVTRSLMESLKQKDSYTYGHCRRVSYLSENLAQTLGLSESEIEVVKYSALYHDLGKIGVPDHILLKKGRLTEEEDAIMRLHPIKSLEILFPLFDQEFFQKLAPGIRHHHERMDGMGYPNQLKGDEIPLEAKIILVADTYDAMTTTRPYRKGLSRDTAYEELIRCSGTQFDEKIVEAFIDSHTNWEKFRKVA